VAISRRILFKSTLAAIVSSGFRARAQTADFSYKYANNLTFGISGSFSFKIALNLLSSIAFW
jgi:hypothetical protein